LPALFTRWLVLRQQNFAEFSCCADGYRCWFDEKEEEINLQSIQRTFPATAQGIDLKVFYLLLPII